MILTPDQRVRVFVSSTLEERAAARRAIRRLHLVPVWYESGARPHPPQSMYRAYLEQSQIFVGIYCQGLFCLGRLPDLCQIVSPSTKWPDRCWSTDRAQGNYLTQTGSPPNAQPNLASVALLLPSAPRAGAPSGLGGTRPLAAVPPPQHFPPLVASLAPGFSHYLRHGTVEVRGCAPLQRRRPR